MSENENADAVERSVVKFVLDSSVSNLVNHEVLLLGNRLKRFKRYLAARILLEEDREDTPNMKNFDTAFRATWKLWKTTPEETRETVCYPEFLKLFLVKNEEITDKPMSQVLSESSNGVMRDELLEICDDLNLYKNTISEKMLGEPEEILESATNLANFDEAFRSGWRIWKSVTDEEDRAKLPYERFRDLMINGSD